MKYDFLEKTNLPKQIFDSWVKQLDAARLELYAILEENFEYDITSVNSSYNGEIAEDLKNSLYSTENGLIEQIQTGIEKFEKDQNFNVFMIRRFCVVQNKLSLMREIISIKV